MAVENVLSPEKGMGGGGGQPWPPAGADALLAKLSADSNTHAKSIESLGAQLRQQQSTLDEVLKLLKERAAAAL